LTHQEQSAFDINFLNTIEQWFTLRGEIFVVARFSHTAGGRDYLWFKKFESFREQVSLFPPQTDIIVFRDNLFPLRGVVDDYLIQQSLTLIPNPGEFMVLNVLEPPDGSLNHAWTGDNHAELLETLRDMRGESVSIGLHPPWHEADNEKMISALIPFSDGTLKRGAY
jgi:hypothetical protein